MEVEIRNECEMCKGWRGGLDPSCEEDKVLGGYEYGNLNVNDKRTLVMYRKVDRIPGTYIHISLKALRWWQ